MPFTPADALKALSAVSSLIDGTALIYNKYNLEPVVGSLAFQELQTEPYKCEVNDSHARGLLAIESASDHLMVVADAFSPPAKTIAPWTCVRGLMEACAIALWLLDPAIDAKTRVGRTFAYRYWGFKEQLKLFKISEDQPDGDKIIQRMDEVERRALALGYLPVLTKNGERNGIGQQMPSIVGLMKETLDMEKDYRLLSAVAHCHDWATHQIGFQLIEVTNSAGEKIKALEKKLHPDLVFYAMLVAVPTYCKTLWSLWQYFGWDSDDLISLFEQIYDRVGFSTPLRFWRQ